MCWWRGDQFDRPVPSPESEEIVYDALLRLAQTGAHVVVVAGNHDSPRRLAAVRPLLELTNMTVAPTVARPDDGGVVRAATRSGETACIALFPFQSKRGIVTAEALMGGDPDHLVAVGVEHPEHHEEVGIGGRGRHEQLRRQRAGDLQLLGGRRR